MDTVAGPFGDGGVVGKLQNSLRGGAAMGVQYQIETKGLRCLHRAQPRSRQGRGDIAVRVNLLDRLGELHAGNGGAVGFCGGDRLIN